MIYHEQPTDPWTDYDFALIEAYQTLEDEKCGQCGNPVWLCRSDSNVFRFKVHKEACHATKALEEYKDSKKPRGERAKAEDKKHWGEFYYTEPELLPPEKEAGTLMPKRSDFFKEKAGLVE